MNVAMTGSYDYRLVALSVLLAIFASYAALDLAGRVTAAQGRTRLFWLAGGATAMGMGIWAMHYIGMLAFTMPVPVFYHLPTVLLSMLTAMAAAAVALFVVSRPGMKAIQGFLGSLLMGGGIAAMHYIGMAAMRLPAATEYNEGIVALSVVLAVAVSWVALLLSFQAREDKRTTWRKMLSALVMGSAISLMHYTGMWAATFQPSGRPLDLSHAVRISLSGNPGHHRH
ncbi:MAG TPA: MHYT domain-containing protein, partial [Candidatus Solibacter sp.]|nr:MHYT domain-containing protein [Candidatus Solibacter sp.]